MIHYCTYFDRNYLTRAIALYRSLARHSPPFTLWALCMDDDALAALQVLRLDRVRPIPLAALEAADQELLTVKESRSTVEYYFTCSPSLPRFLLGQNPDIDLITYLDADLLFYSSPEPIFDELGDGSVLIVPHRFPESLRHLEVYGVYNVGLLSFRNDPRGRAVLDHWREQCIEWCYDRVEDGRFADQGYLDAWPGRPGVVVLQNPGGGLAPWNAGRYAIDLSLDPPTVDARPFIFYHFQAVKLMRRRLWDMGLDGYAPIDRPVRAWLYRGYVHELESAARLVAAGRTGGSPRPSSVRPGSYSWRQIADKVRRGQVVFSLGKWVF